MGWRRALSAFRLTLSAAVALVCVNGMATTSPARADEPRHPSITLRITGVELEHPENTLQSPTLTCPPLCDSPHPPQVDRRQRFTMDWVDTWTDEARVRLYRRAPFGTGGLLQEFPVNAGTGRRTTYTTPWLQGGVSHCFQIVFADATGVVQKQSTRCAGSSSPSKPGTPQVVWSDSSSADIQFSKSADFEAGYLVYGRRNNDTQWTVMSAGVSEAGPVPAGKRRYRVGGLLPNSTYCFQVSGSHALGESARSASACGTTVASPTAGWTVAHGADFFIRKPWDVDANDRFRYDSTGVFTTWVFKTDKPFAKGSPTKPRTEMAWDPTYTAGQHMWEADVFVPADTDNACIMQIFRSEHADNVDPTDVMLRFFAADGGSLRLYSDAATTFATGLSDRWFNLKVSHNVSTDVIRIYVDDRLVKTTTPASPAPSGQKHRFKNGVYGTDGPRAEARFRYFTFWTR